MKWDAIECGAKQRLLVRKGIDSPCWAFDGEDLLYLDYSFACISDESNHWWSRGCCNIRRLTGSWSRMFNVHHVVGTRMGGKLRTDRVGAYALEDPRWSIQTDVQLSRGLKGWGRVREITETQPNFVSDRIGMGCRTSWIVSYLACIGEPMWEFGVFEGPCESLAEVVDALRWIAL